MGTKDHALLSLGYLICTNYLNSIDYTNGRHVTALNTDNVDRMAEVLNTYSSFAIFS